MLEQFKSDAARDVLSVIEMLNILRDQVNFDKVNQFVETIKNPKVMPIRKFLKVIAKIEQYNLLKHVLYEKLTQKSKITELLKDESIVKVIDTLRRDNEEFKLNPDGPLEQIYEKKLLNELKY